MKFAVDLPNGRSIPFESDRSITHAIVLSPANKARWIGSVTTRLTKARTELNQLRAAGRNPLIVSRPAATGVVHLTLSSTTRPEQPVLVWSYSDMSSEDGEAALMRKASERVSVLQEAVRNARELLNRIEEIEFDPNDFQVLRWGTGDIANMINDFSSRMQEGRTVSLSRVYITEMASA